MKKNFLLSIFLLISTTVLAQKKASLLETIIKEVEERIVPTHPKSKTPNIIYKDNKTPNVVLTDDNFLIEIPVVFHVVMKEKPSSLLTPHQFQKNLNLLNEALNNTIPEYINSEYQNIIGTANLKFVMANEFYNCENLDGYTFHYTDKENFKYVYIQDNPYYGFYDGSLKMHGYLDSGKVLNIWICRLDNSTALGYSTFPQEKNKKNDGVVIAFDAFFSPIEDTRRFAMAHEVGHYLGLRHIWSNCNLIQGDLVVDTPPQANKNTLEKVTSGNVEKVCGSITKISNYQNYMDYVGLYGMFTKGQVSRMREQIKKHRSELLNRNGCPQDDDGPIVTNNPTESQTGIVGEVCFSNPNMYSRKVVLTNIKTGKSTSTTVGLAYYPKSTTRCLYDLQPGVYECKIYTTFTNTLTENFQLKISSSQQTIKIAKDGFN